MPWHYYSRHAIGEQLNTLSCCRQSAIQQRGGLRSILAAKGAVDTYAHLRCLRGQRVSCTCTATREAPHLLPDLVLTAYSTAQTQRKILLHKSREIRKEDAANLKALSQSSIWNGGCITGLTQLSRLIQWFRLMFHMKIARDELDSEEDPHATAVNRSEAIDRALLREATALRQETKIVLVGGTRSGKDLIMHQMKVLYAEGYYSVEERTKYRYAVWQVVRGLMYSITNLLKDTGVVLSAELNKDFAILLHEGETPKDEGFTLEAVQAINNIWASSEFSTLYVRNFEIDFPQYAPYFAQEARRIADKDYVPTEADIIRLNQSMRGINELRFNWDELDVHLFNIKGYVPQHFRERWFHQLEGATALIYTMDVSLYDKPNPSKPNESLLVTEFEGFESWINQPGFANTSIILLLNNFTRFVGKLAYSPLKKYFPDHTPNECDPELSARQYILRRFKNANHQGLSIYSFWVDLDLSDNHHLFTALKKSLTRIQERKAQDEVRNASVSATDSSRPSTNETSNLLSPTKSLSRKKEDDDRARVAAFVQRGGV
jgi:guanine nucleotide-binding protein G(i) subunit alpha